MNNIVNGKYAARFHSDSKRETFAFINGGNGYSAAWRKLVVCLARTAAAIAAGIAFLVMSTGCARTRIGALIPAHVRSEKTKGELVTARYIQTSKQSPRVAKSTAAGSMTASVAAFAAGIAVDALKQELVREAKAYEHQHGARLLLTTDELGTGGIIVVTRWIDGKRERLEPGQRKSVYSHSDETPSTGDLVTLIEDQSELADEGEEDKVLAEMIRPKNGKRPAQVLTLRVRREGASSVYRIASAKLWVSAVGAKVVSFGWGNLPKFWQWPGALLMKTDSQAEIEAGLKVKALMQVGNTGEYKWGEVKPESGILSSIKVNLGELPKTFDLGNNVGAWMAVPTIGAGTAARGFVVMDFTLNERDTSNAKKYLEQAASAVDKNRGSIVDAVTKIAQ